MKHRSDSGFYLLVAVSIIGALLLFTGYVLSAAIA